MDMVSEANSLFDETDTRWQTKKSNIWMGWEEKVSNLFSHHQLIHPKKDKTNYFGRDDNNCYAINPHLRQKLIWLLAHISRRFQSALRLLMTIENRIISKDIIDIE
mgnify:CR=1 FL=1